MSNEKRYKWLFPGRNAPFQEDFQYPEVGTWTEPVEGPLHHCGNGYHSCSARGLSRWAPRNEGPCDLYEVEESVEHLADRQHKRPARQLRLVRLVVAQLSPDTLMGAVFPDLRCPRGCPFPTIACVPNSKKRANMLLRYLGEDEL